MSLGVIGLGLVLVAWFIQLLVATQGYKNLNSGFLFIYIVGVALVAWEALANGEMTTMWLNLGCVIVAALVFMVLRK